jgi:hypothetical protein
MIFLTFHSQKIFLNCVDEKRKTRPELWRGLGWRMSERENKACGFPLFVNVYQSARHVKRLKYFSVAACCGNYKMKNV